MTIINSLLTNFTELASNYLLETALSPTSLMIGGTALAVSIANGCFFSRSSIPLSDQIEKLVKSCEGKPKNEAKSIVKIFINKNWINIAGAENCLNNTENKEAIYKKIFKVVYSRFDNHSTKTETCKKIFKNFKSSNANIIQTIQKDIQADDEFRALFNIPKETGIAKIERLGDETHHRGLVPLFIEFSNGTKIIYKPRSMIAEKNICGHINSYFSRLRELGKDLGVYRVHNKGSYGYCEFVENKPEENAFECQSDLRDYAKKFITLERYASLIGLSDLHNENIITKAKVPYTIDVEVVMMPRELKDVDTMLLGGPCPGWMIEEDTKNKITWKNKGGKKVDFRNDFDFFIEYLTEEKENSPTLSSKEEKIAIGCKNLLAIHNHRILIIETASLSTILQHSMKEATKTFMESLEDKLRIMGFTKNVAADAEVQEKFKQDFLNNDVPIFYFNPASRSVFYDDLLIGRYSVYP